MLFSESVEKYDPTVKLAVDELFDAAYKYQKNPNDLVLLLANGSYANISDEALKSFKITPYQIGHDEVHFRYISFYEFINQYKQVVSKVEFDNSFEDNEDKELYLNTMIQMQLLCYMKFWETDLMLKRLLNLSNLSQGIDYLWKIDQEELDERRPFIRDKIQKPLENICPNFYNLLDETYTPQIRNAIAHSQYYLMYNSINLTNKDHSEYYKLRSVDYQKWDEIFTKLILTHNHIIQNFNKYNDIYSEQAKVKHNGLIVYFPEKDHFGLNKTAWVKYIPGLGMWDWGK